MDEDAEADSCVLSHIVRCINNAHHTWSPPPTQPPTHWAKARAWLWTSGPDLKLEISVEGNWSSVYVTFYLVHLATQSNQIRNHSLWRGYRVGGTARDWSWLATEPREQQSIIIFIRPRLDLKAVWNFDKCNRASVLSGTAPKNLLQPAKKCPVMPCVSTNDSFSFIVWVIKQSCLLASLLDFAKQGVLFLFVFSQGQKIVT